MIAGRPRATCARNSSASGRTLLRPRFGNVRTTGTVVEQRARAAAGIGAPIVALAAVAFMRWRPTPADEAIWLSILPPPGGFDLSPDPAVSPDGRYIAFKAQDRSIGHKSG